MAWAGGNYSPFSPSEQLNLSFDFVDLANGQALTAANLTISSLAIGPVTDPNPSAILISGPAIVASKVNFTVANGRDGAVYLFDCKATLANNEVVDQWAELPCIGPPPPWPHTSPSIGGFYWFIENIMGIPGVELPRYGIIYGAFQASGRTVNSDIQSVAAEDYTNASYNLAASLLINIAPDQPGQTYFKDLRKDMNLTGFTPGVVTSGADVSTSESLVVPEFFKNLTMGDLQRLRDPWGRAYLEIAQQSGPTIWGLS